MDELRYESSTLWIGSKQIRFEHPVYVVLPFRGLWIVLTLPPEIARDSQSVYAVSKSGEIVWRVADSNPNGYSPTGGIFVEDDQLLARDYDDYELVIDAADGSVRRTGNRRH